MLKIDVNIVDWPLAVPFTISRETLYSIPCIQVTLTDAQGRVGRGEAVGVDYAGETPETMIAQIEAVRTAIESGITLDSLQPLLPPGGARNGVDCALWDLIAKQSGIPAWRTAGLKDFQPRPTAFSFGIMDEAALRATARKYAHFPLLKIKTNKELGLDPVRIIHEEAPRAKFIVDPNQAWGADDLNRFAPDMTKLNIALLEQPVAINDDEILRELSLPVPVAADEAFTDRSGIRGFIGKYQVLNIKLDKTGGLTEGMACVHAGRAAGFGLMIGCMVGSSLSMAPGTIVAQYCDFADLDGPLLQSTDVDYPLSYEGGMISTPTANLWG
jgi:L-Ala-D/L-Glu epimerase